MIATGKAFLGPGGDRRISTPAPRFGDGGTGGCILQSQPKTNARELADKYTASKCGCTSPRLQTAADPEVVPNVVTTKSHQDCLHNSTLTTSLPTDR